MFSIRGNKGEHNFQWEMLGDIELGRPNLGNSTSVAAYRLMQFTLRDILIKEYGREAADTIFFEAGRLAGSEFYHNLLQPADSFNDFVVQLQEALKQLKIGILRIEKSNVEQLQFTFAVAEDLDCAGLPVTDEEICTYDEGFLSGILSEYSGKPLIAEEVDCWCSGDRVCRFEIKPS